MNSGMNYYDESVAHSDAEAATFPIASDPRASAASEIILHNFMS